MRDFLVENSVAHLSVKDNSTEKDVLLFTFYNVDQR